MLCPFLCPFLTTGHQFHETALIHEAQQSTRVRLSESQGFHHAILGFQVIWGHEVNEFSHLPLGNTSVTWVRSRLVIVGLGESWSPETHNTENGTLSANAWSKMLVQSCSINPPNGCQKFPHKSMISWCLALALMSFVLVRIGRCSRFLSATEMIRLVFFVLRSEGTTRAVREAAQPLYAPILHEIVKGEPLAG